MQDQGTIDSDIASVQRIAALPKVLSAVADVTGMRFTAVARVTESRWIACAVNDSLGFGLAQGGELELETTICNEIRGHHTPVVFNQASEHPVWSQHHTPKRYGLESYISVPIFRANGEFFGTLCAIDSRPAEVDKPVVVKTLSLFAELIGQQLELVDHLDATRTRLRNAEFREQLVSATQRDVLDLFQPIAVNLYLLRNSHTLGLEDRTLVKETDAWSKQLTEMLGRTLDAALSRVEQRLEAAEPDGPSAS